jgi:phosphosulfolactate synthase
VVTGFEERAFGTIPMAERPGKPRTVGLTVTVEFGVGLAAQRDYLELAGDAMDYAKQVVSTAGLMPRELLRHKIELYREQGVKAFPGGMFLEHACGAGLVEEYLQECRAVGYDVVEVSENARPMPHATRDDIIRRARDLGLEVLGEVGSKHVKSTPAQLVDDIGSLMALGCSKVLVEAAELMDGGVVDRVLLDALESQVDVADCVFELPGPWIPGVSLHEVYSLQNWLIARFGADVNIANDTWGQTLYLEASRRRVAANLFEPT